MRSKVKMEIENVLGESKKNQPNLWGKLLLKRDPDFGGSNTLALGRLGSGKTSLLVHILKRLLELQDRNGRPDEFFWWRGQGSCQWAKFLDMDFQIYAPNDMDLRFITKEGEKDMNILRYRNYDDLLEKGEPNLINVVYFGDYGNVIDLMERVQESSFEWHSFAVDETDDVAPWPASGETHKKCMKASDIIKETRKNKTSFYACTQGWGSLHWALKHKFMSKTYLVGAPKPKDSPVWKSAIRGLELGEGWLSSGGQFQKITFPPYKTQKDIKAVFDGTAGSEEDEAPSEGEACG